MRKSIIYLLLALTLATAVPMLTQEQKSALIADYRELIKVHPDLLSLYTGLAVTCISQNTNRDDARWAIEQLSATDKGRRTAYYLQVALANAEGRPKDADASLRAYLAAEPFAALEISQLPTPEFIAGMSASVKMTTEQIVEAPPFIADTAYLDHAHNQESRLREYLRQNPEDRQAQYYLGMHFLADERYKEAEQVFGRLEAQRVDGLSSALRGVALEMLGKPREAQSEYLKALQTNFGDWPELEREQAKRLGLADELSWLMPPDGTYYLDAAWRSLAASGRYAEALELTERYSNALYHVRAYLRSKLGDAEGARRELLGVKFSLLESSVWTMVSGHLFMAAVLELNGLSDEARLWQDRAAQDVGIILTHSIRDDFAENIRQMRIASFYELSRPLRPGESQVNPMGDKKPDEHPLVGKTLPDVEFVEMDGRGIKLPATADHWRLLWFWRSDCAPSVREVEDLKQLTKTQSGLEIICVNLGEETKAINEYMQKYELEWRMLRAGGSQAEALSVAATPTMMLINPEGMVKAVFQGYARADVMSGWMK